MSISPARIICNWDFQLVKVSHAALKHIEESRNLPLIDLPKLNPYIYQFNAELQKVQNLRQELIVLRDFILSCKMNTRNLLLSQIWPREYLIENANLFSIHDLEEVYKESLSVFLATVASSFKKHVLYQCEVRIR
jgi:hypothetical protein